MDAPFLFDLNRLTDKSLAVFKRQAFINCGREFPAYRYLNEIPPDFAEYLDSAPDEFQKAWRDEFAAEALVAGLANDRIKGIFPFSWVDPKAHPCGIFGPTYAECQGKPLALALFPLADEFGGNKNPTIGRIWLFKSLSSIPQTLPKLDGIEHFGEEHIGESHRMFVDIATWKDESTIWPAGESWQLAAHVAAKMLDENSRLIELATSWLLSGAVSGHEVKKIGLMSKLKLDVSGRQWILPISNHDEISLNILVSKVFYLSEAYSCVRGADSFCLVFPKNILTQKPENIPPVRSNDLKERITTKSKGDPMSSNQTTQANETSNNSDNSQIVIFLTNRRPVKISPEKWPVIMKVEWDYSEIPYEDAHVKGELFVRAKQADDKRFRYLVNGKSHKDMGIPEMDDKWGYMLDAGELVDTCSLTDSNNHSAPELIESIKRVAKSLKENGDEMVCRLFNSLEPEVLD